MIQQTWIVFDCFLDLFSEEVHFLKSAVFHSKSRASEYHLHSWYLFWLFWLNLQYQLVWEGAKTEDRLNLFLLWLFPSIFSWDFFEFYFWWEGTCWIKSWRGRGWLQRKRSQQKCYYICSQLFWRIFEPHSDYWMLHLFLSNSQLKLKMLW